MKNLSSFTISSILIINQIRLIELLMLYLTTLSKTKERKKCFELKIQKSIIVCSFH